MDLISFISDSERKRRLAQALGSSEGYLWQIATKWRGKRASPSLAIAIEKETLMIGPHGVRKESLRPDIWGESNEVEAESNGKGRAPTQPDPATPDAPMEAAA